MGDDPQVADITSLDLKKYIVWITTEYIPVRKNGKKHLLSPKTTRNFFITLQDYFRWLGEEFEIPSPINGIPVQVISSPTIEPLPKEELISLLKGCNEKRKRISSNPHAFTTSRPTKLRDQTVIKFLLDTGLRVSEFSCVQIGDVDLVTGRVMIKTGKEGGAKGGQGRIVLIGNEVRRALWKYLKD